MASASRSVRINLTRDLPARAVALTGEALANVLGGCKRGGQECSSNADCCSWSCSVRWWLSEQRIYRYECSPCLYGDSKNGCPYW
jgi:hypothetical protein